MKSFMEGKKMEQIALVTLLIYIVMSGVGLVYADVIRVPNHHKTIQAAFNAAQIGDTIFVAEGEYHGEISLKDGVTLQGSGEESILKSAVLSVNVTDAVITDFAMKGGTANDHFGIFCRNTKITVTNMTIWGFHHAISAENSDVTIQNNAIISSFNVGIIVTSHSSALIEENEIAENQGTGITISSTNREVFISNNTIEKNYITGIECHGASPIIRGNLITQNSYGLKIDNAQPNLGTVDDPGLNFIYGNPKGDVINFSKNSVSAQQNYWGNPDGPCDECIVGQVDYTPWLQDKHQVDSKSVHPLSNSVVIWGQLKHFSR